MDAYKPPRHIGVRNVSTLAASKDVAFWVEAVRQQVATAADLWGLPAPGVVFYDRSIAVRSEEASIVNIVDDGGVKDAAGYHNPLAGTVDMSRSESPPRSLSHEVLEMLRNLYLAAWVPGPRGLFYAMEIVDAVQSLSYEIPVTINGETVKVEVSDFLLPAWFKMTATRPFDFLDLLTAPFELAPGGYAIAEDDLGQTVMLAHRDGARLDFHKWQPSSRTWRLATGR